MRLPSRARDECNRDSLGLPPVDPGAGRCLEEAVQWLSRAQDFSLSADGGIARHYSLIDGWGHSYPETTGYIVPTLLNSAASAYQADAEARARRMLDWLVSIQLSCGGFKGGRVGRLSPGPVTFNTGQILLGLAAGAGRFGAPYGEAMRKSADWLVETQDPDGCWRRYPTPFAVPGEKTYETHVAWGLFEAARVEPHRGYAEAALANVRWALMNQRENGWFDACCLSDPSEPLTHTIGYALRGVVEAYVFSKDAFFLNAARKTADALIAVTTADGFLPGRLRKNWQAAVPWVCLTGSAQIACCWLLLYEAVGDRRYCDAALAVNRFVRRTMKVDGAPETRGAIKGSFPVGGGYGPYQYLNWACKFFIDANILETRIESVPGARAPACERAAQSPSPSSL